MIILTPRTHGVAKYLVSQTFDATKVHSTIPCSPLSALSADMPNRAPA